MSVLWKQNAMKKIVKRGKQVEIFDYLFWTILYYDHLINYFFNLNYLIFRTYTGGNKSGKWPCDSTRYEKRNIHNY